MILLHANTSPRATWEFTLSRDLVADDEQAIFAGDLARLALDEVAWLILNGTATTRTPHSIPKVLRGYLNNRLAGVAYVVECRQYGQSLFAQARMAMLFDKVKLPICIWLRHGALNDGISNPGFVADGVARPEFVTHAIRFLRQSYLLGGIVEGEDEQSAGIFASFPFCAHGVIDLHHAHSADDLYPDSKNLRRKVNKFRNKGGEIEIRSGALPTELSDTAIRCLQSIKAVLRSPFQDNYNNMVLCASAHNDPRIVHFIARIEGECVGYHSFARTETALYCLSGAFDRTRHTNYHAYENLILESVNYSLAEGIEAIYYGMVVNETKAKMMSRFVSVEQRYFARFALLNGIVGKVMAATRLTSPEITAYAHRDDGVPDSRLSV